MARSSSPGRGARGQASLGRLLEGILTNLDLGPRLREQRALALWPEVAGPLIAAHSRPEVVRDGVLIIAADTPAWAQELQMRTRELLDRLAARLGPGVIRDLHFRSGVRRRRPARAAEPRPADIVLTGRQERAARAAAEHIEDPALRARAERAFAALARMGEWRRRTGWRRCRRCGNWQRIGKRWCASCLHRGRRGRR